MDVLSDVLAICRAERAVTARFHLFSPWGLRSDGVAGSAVIRMARGDLSIRTALLESRYLWGDQALYDEAERLNRSRGSLMDAEERIQRLADETLERVGDVDILVNNAGATWGAPAQDHPLDAWDKVMNLNVRGYFLLSQAIAKASMIPRKQGRIINVASIAGLGGNHPFMQTIAYNTSKGAVVNFTKALACEWGHLGIRVNAIAPGFFPSKMTAGTLAAVGEERLASAAPLQRLGDDEDLKGLTLLFASEAGKHITGQILAVDGGVSAVIGG